MTIPEGFSQITHTFTGVHLPNGAAVVYGVGNPTDEDPAVIAELCHGEFTNFMGQLSAGVTLESTLCKNGPDATGPSFEFIDPVPGAVAVGVGLAPNSAYLLTKSTAVGGRRGKGRTFMPGVSETVVDGAGLLTAAFQEAMQDIANAMVAGLIIESHPMVLLHGPATEWVLVDGQPKRVPVAGPIPEPDQVTAWTVSARVGTQRRRLR